MSSEREAFEAFFPAASANWLPRSRQYSGKYADLWEGWQSRGGALDAPAPLNPVCIGNDPLCPCQDGDACHYRDAGDTKAWPIPQGTEATAQPAAEHPLLQRLVDSIEVVNGSACWDYMAMYEVRDALASLPEATAPALTVQGALTDEQILLLLCARDIPGATMDSHISATGRELVRLVREVAALSQATAQPAGDPIRRNEVSPNFASRVMFVARLSSGDQDTMMSCRDVLALLNDCDYLASLPEATAQPALSLGLLLCELMECDAAGPFSDAMPPDLLEKWQDACDAHITSTADRHASLPEATAQPPEFWIQLAREHCYNKTNAEILAMAAAAAPALPVQGASAACQHDWHIWPETDGLEQRCALCKEYRSTPEADKFWLRAAPESPQAPALSERADALLALERVAYNFRLLLAGKPVRDVAETLAEADRALATPEARTLPVKEKS